MSTASSSPTSSPTPGRPSAVVDAARIAVFVAFLVNGALFASFASRVPDIKLSLELSAGELGVTLLAASVGSVLALPLSGWVVHRIGAARTLVDAALVQGTGLLLVGAGVTLADDRLVVMAGLFLAGVGIGVYDVGMNLEGGAVEQRLGRAIMPHFHAFFSGGTVLAALIGAVLSRFEVPVLLHLSVAVAVLVVATLWLTRRFLARAFEADVAGGGDRAGDGAAGDGAGARAGAGIGAAWREPRTLLIGVVVFAAAFTEGVANDWIAVAFHEGYGLAPWVGVLGFAVFLSAMTAGRLLGTRLLDRYGRVPVLRALFAAAVVGCLLVVFGGPWLAFLGAVVWGLGASLGFPVGMSAASDEPSRAPARMSVVSTIGYTAFIGGPPLLGFLGDHVGVLRSLLVVGLMAAVALLVVQNVRPPTPSTVESPEKHHPKP